MNRIHPPRGYTSVEQRVLTRARKKHRQVNVPCEKVLTVPREKLSGNFKNMGDVESNLTALKMASLKGIKRSTKVRREFEFPLIPLS